MRTFLSAFIIAASLAAGGCTVAGAALGASTPHYEPTAWPRSNVELGAHVRVRMRNVGADSPLPRALEGRGIREELMSLTDDDGREHELPVRDVVALDVRNGSQWQKGLLLGAAADTMIVVAVVAVARGANISFVTGQ
jgi:hypothetical protein